MRRRWGTGVAAVLLALAPALAACGSGGKPPPSHPTNPVALWNPCDGLPLTTVERLFDASMTVDTGTPTEPACDFTPKSKGDPVVNANYQLFKGSVASLIASFGAGKAQILTQAVPRSQGARLIVQARQQTLLVTGYVKNGDLMQTVNVVAAAPYRRQDVLTATHGLLVLLSRHAVSSGLTGSTATATPSPGAPSTTPPPTPAPPSSTP